VNQLTSEWLHNENPLLRAIDANRVPQGAAEPADGDLHHTAILETGTVLETEHVGAEKMDVDVSRVAMPRMLEVMMFQGGERMAHPALGAGLWSFPNHLADALDCCPPGHTPSNWVRGPIRVLARNRAVSIRRDRDSFRLQQMIGDFIRLRHAEAKRYSIRTHHVNTDEFGLFVAFQGVS